LVVRIFSRHIITQVVEYQPTGDRVIVDFNSVKLREFGWKYSCKNIPAAYLTGVVIAKLALKHRVKQVIADFGFHPAVKGSRLFAVVKGAFDAGLNIAVGESMFPNEERLKGQHIESYLKQGNFASKYQFSRFKKASSLLADFEKIKQRIMKNEKGK